MEHHRPASPHTHWTEPSVPDSMQPQMSDANGPSTMMSEAPPQPSGHMMRPDDPDNPQNWPIPKKLYTSAVATAYGFVVAFGATAYAVGIPGVMVQFDVSMTKAILPFPLFFWGIMFAPVWVPHLSERIGRQLQYPILIFIFALFTLGASFSQSLAALSVCRFFAGFFGGPALVLIEGTYADVWSADYTVTYYAGLTLASFLGTASGPLVTGFLFAFGGWRWTLWITLIITLPALLFGVAMPETYGREILRRRSRRNGQPIKLAKAASGVTFSEMAQLTVIDPIKMAVTEPIVIGLSLYVGLIFALIFQFFVAIPVVLSLTYNFTVQQAGIAFTSAIAGTLLAAATASAIEILTRPRGSMGAQNETTRPLEWRMLPALLGGPLITGSLFWIAWTASPTTHFLVPIFGTMVFIWGSFMVLTSSIAYLFDAYTPPGTLSALTAAACFRLAMAGFLPLVIIQMIQGLTGAWAYSTFGFIAAAVMLIPYLIFVFGARWRVRSKYSEMTPAAMMGAMGKQSGGGAGGDEEGMMMRREMR